ncbi:hypothetical protein [Haloferula sp.]|uniref:hypothetical protein n=1 Tax=Haloferula sp. TaxID=2497595 RepID=UPI003C73553E
MKVSILISLLILAAALVFGWRSHRELSQLRVEHQRVVEEAEGLGMAINMGEGGELVRGPLSRAHADREAETMAFAAEIIAFAKKMKEREKNGGENDEEFQKEVMQVMKRFLDLDAKQLKDLVAELKGSTEIDEEMRQGIVGFSIMMLANESPEAALALYTESSELLGMDGMGKHVVSSSLSRLAERDPFAAMDWIRENGEKNPDLVTDDTKAAVIAGAARQDPAMAIQLMEELKMEHSGSAANGIARAASTSEERLRLLESLRGLADGKDLKQEVLRSLGQQVTQDGYEASVEWLNEANLSDKELKVFGEGLNYHQTQKDTGKWLDWMGEAYSGDEVKERTTRLMGDWTRNDFQAAGTWLNDAEDGPTKQAAVKSYAETVAPYEPEAAAQWALTLPSGKDRDQVIKRIHAEWKKKDEAAAAAFATEQGLD